MVKTAASHAVNIGSNPVWVTNFLKKMVDKCQEWCYNLNVKSQLAFNIKDGESHPHELALIAMRVHLFPSRTPKLSSFAPTILGGRLPGKIGNANTHIPL